MFRPTRHQDEEEGGKVIGILYISDWTHNII